jgi:UDPglucose 6-dehydrogenase
MFVRELGRQVHRATPLMDGVLTSNTTHRAWAFQRLQEELGSLERRRIAVWGLTYKPGTDTLRRSTAGELCDALVRAGAEVFVHDPAARHLPESLHQVRRESDPVAASAGADALVVATEWPEYRRVAAEALVDRMKQPLVIDANRFLGNTIGSDARVRLISVGRG